MSLKYELASEPLQEKFDAAMAERQKLQDETDHHAKRCVIRTC